jgi:hypothetical protein
MTEAEVRRAAADRLQPGNPFSRTGIQSAMGFERDGRGSIDVRPAGGGVEEGSEGVGQNSLP